MEVASQTPPKIRASLEENTGWHRRFSKERQMEKDSPIWRNTLWPCTITSLEVKNGGVWSRDQR